MDQGLKDPSADRPEPRPLPLLPESCRCEMPEQLLWRRKGRPRTPTRTRFARVALVAMWCAGVTAFAWTLYRVLSVETPTVLQLVFLFLSTLCFGWVALGSASALVGFMALMSTRSVDTLELPEPALPVQSRTALLFPVYREEPTDMAALIAAVCDGVIAAGAGDGFDVFILSDTQDTNERACEQRSYLELRSRYGSRLPIYIRWRTPNEGKKAGNIRDWVERFGGRYPYFIIFDADSLMSATALLRLVAGMDRHPQAGLIQTVPRLVDGRTMFSRLQQFAAAYYGPVVAAGLAMWHGHGGNYWGHNAIIRTRAFAECAGLPRLPGEPPLGGYILSHDFVEAALMRRGGWEVHMVPSLEGSYEGCPPTLADLVVRDRRWAQGNLQHLRLIGSSGLPFLSRVHLAMGALSYLASPLWALTLLVGVVLAVQAQYATPAYFGTEASLFPKWPVFDAEKALALFLATVLVVHLPKLLGGAWALRNVEERRRHGGAARIVQGILVESVLSTLVAPILMVTQSGAVLNILAGRDAGWGAQQRQLAATPTAAQFMIHHRWQMAWGLVCAVVCASISFAILAWMSPVIVGLLFAAPVAILTSRAGAPRLAQVLATPEDRDPPLLLTKVDAFRARQEELGPAPWAAAVEQQAQNCPSVIVRDRNRSQARIG
jgi:membrane glycosyltransferase